MSKIKYLILLILWLVFISTLSLIDLNLEDTPKIDNTDKVVHFFFHFFLSLFLVLHLTQERMYKMNKRLFYLVVVFSVVYGILIEVFQAVFTINRHSDFYDVLANTTGSLVFLLSYSYFLHLKRQ